VADRFLRQVRDRSWQISPWVDGQPASALAIQNRRGVITPEERDAGWQRFQELRQQRLQVLTLDAADFEAAGRLCLTGSAARRAGDARHLALCQRHRSTLVSFGPVMCEAAAQHRIEAALLRIEA
jgi:hypothetical protein